MYFPKHKYSIQEKRLMKSLDWRYLSRRKECILQPGRGDYFLDQLLLMLAMGDAVPLALVFIPLSTPLLNCAVSEVCWCLLLSLWLGINLSLERGRAALGGQVCLHVRLSAFCSFTYKFSRLYTIHYAPPAPSFNMCPFPSVQQYWAFWAACSPPSLPPQFTGPHCSLCLKCFSVLSSFHLLLPNSELIICFADKDGEALQSQQKQDRELTVAQIMNSLLQNSELNWRT